ncbi:uncharacterized protein LOC116289341 [Actinia tenebrosa]|uniref:Uncharacterized protein LOC116289341 n=1 Tax=Actinia tenebrosa TaxID=6105 RepID=A0A6P8HHK2_ACTTE|nr:uncharacterized protein LOC116289341 [Actinia tenebrosa]
MAAKLLLFVPLLSFIFKPGQSLQSKFDKKGEVRFGNFLNISDGQILEINGSVINKMTVKDKNQCLVECVNGKECLSINLYSDQPNQVQCELLNWAGTAFHSLLKPKANSQSMMLATACSPNPCQNGGDCIAYSGGHQYNCSCIIPFTGDNCEKAEGCVLFDFENGLPGWTRTGTAFNNQPTYGDNSLVRKPAEPAKQRGDWYIGTFENRTSPSHPAGGIQDDFPTGTMTSPKFTIRGRSLKFLIGGGSDVNKERVELLIGGAVVAKAASQTNVETMKLHAFDVTSYRGQVAQLRLVDDGSSGWEHINVDHFEDSICSE